MKKLLSIILAILLLTTPALAEEPALHTLWDMPLDITADEFEVFIKDKLDVVLKREEYDSGAIRISMERGELDTVRTETGGFKFEYTEHPPITLFDLPIYFSATFHGESEPVFTDIFISFDNSSDGTQDDARVLLMPYANVYAILCERYGYPTLTRFYSSKSPKDEETGYTINYAAPTKNGKDVDFDAILDELSGEDPFVDVRIRWDNVTLSITGPGEKGFASTMFVGADIPELPQLAPFESRPEPTPAPTPKPIDLSDAF